MTIPFSHCLICPTVKLRPAHATWDRSSFYCGYKRGKSGGERNSHYRVFFSSGFKTIGYEEEYTHALFGTVFSFYVTGTAEQDGFGKYNRLPDIETKIYTYGGFNNAITLNRFFDINCQEDLDYLQNYIIIT